MGIELVDTSSAYGLSENVIGHAPARLSVATKFGNPSERNGERHDYSLAHCADSLYASIAALQGKPVACFQLHSPPECPSPLTHALVDLLESLRAAGKFGAWGASVHSINGGQVALGAGAQMLQVPFNLLQQDNAALLALCLVRNAGVLVQSSLCQGWLTRQGVQAARLLLSAPHRLPEQLSRHGSTIHFVALLRRVLTLDEIARHHGMPLQEMALRFALHAPGATSVLVQVRTASQLREIAQHDLAPLPHDCTMELIALGASADPHTGALVHGSGAKLWTWGVPTPRRCIESAIGSFVPGGAPTLLALALGDGTAGAERELRLSFVERGFVKLAGAFPKEVAAQMAREAEERASPDGQYHAYATRGGYYRTDASCAIGPEVPRCTALEAALEALLDASLFGADDVHAKGFLHSATLETAQEGVFRHSVAGHHASPLADVPRGAWSPPDGLRPGTCDPIGSLNGWHIDDGFTLGGDFRLESYLARPWMVVVVCLTDVEPHGGPTVLCPGSHHAMSRMLTVAPRWLLSTHAIYSFCCAAHHWARRISGRPEAVVEATGAAGDVFLLHPLLVHSPTISITGQARAILNIPAPYDRPTKLGQKQGALSAVTLPIQHALARRSWLPLPLLWLLWGLVVLTGHAHRHTRGVRGAGALARARCAALYVPSCAFYLLNLSLVVVLSGATACAPSRATRPFIDGGGGGGRCAPRSAAGRLYREMYALNTKLVAMVIRTLAWRHDAPPPADTAPLLSPPPSPPSSPPAVAAAASWRLRLDVVVPSVRADASRLLRIASLPIPPEFCGLRFIFVVDGPQPAAAWEELRAMAAQPPGEGGVHLVSTHPSQHGWPAGAGATRNAGIRESDADWVLFLDDDTAPQPDLLFRYAEAAAHWLHTDQGPFVYGFCGTTHFLTPRASTWAVAARYVGMFSGFDSASRDPFPPWAPTANLMLRRTGVLMSAETRGRDGAPLPVTCGGGSDGSGGEAALPFDEETAPVDESASLVQSAAPTPAPVPAAACAPGKRLLPWCFFDESLPRNGGAEDVDICLRASECDCDCDGAAAASDAEMSEERARAKRVLVGVPLAVTAHKMWSPLGMLSRGVRWGYAGGLLRSKYPQLSLSRAFSLVELLVFCSPLSAILAAAISSHWHRGGVTSHAASAAMLNMLLLVLWAFGRRLAGLQRRIMLSPYLPPEMRVSLDEEAFEHLCGASRKLRCLALLFTHLGPIFWLQMAFELGEFGAVTERPFTRWRNIGRRWDFSFGTAEKPPPAAARALERSELCEACGLMLLAVVVAVNLSFV